MNRMNATQTRTSSFALADVERLLAEHQAALLSRNLANLEDCVGRLREAIAGPPSPTIAADAARITQAELKLGAFRVQQAARVQIALLRRQQQFGRFLARLVADPAEPYRVR